MPIEAILTIKAKSAMVEYANISLKLSFAKDCNAITVKTAIEKSVIKKDKVGVVITSYSIHYTKLYDTCGTGNTGFFGIPLAMILLDPNSANIFIFGTLASLLYENTTGFFVTAKGSFTA